MVRREFLSMAGFGTIGVVAGFSALPAEARKKKKRIDMSGEYEGTVEVDGVDVPFKFDIDRSNRRNGNVEGNADLFGDNFDIEGRISSGSSVLEFEGESGNETFQFRGRITERGRRLTGTWKAIKDGEVVSEGTFTVERVDDNDD